MINKFSNNVYANKTLAVFLLLLFILSSIFTSPVNINADSAVYYKVMQTTSEERAGQSESLLSIPKVAIDKQVQTKPQSTDEGSYFSLLPLLSYTPSERDQGYTGTCWAWAGTGVMEIALSVQLGIKDRLSIQYLDSIYNGGSGDDWAGFGGYASTLALFYDEQQKIIPWANINAHYQDYNSFEGAAISSDEIAANPCYLIESVSYASIETYNIGQETAISNIKYILHQNKGVFFGFSMSNEDYWRQFSNFWSNEPESSIWNHGFADYEDWDYETGGGHGVLCVGYDDSDPDPAKHCWIMLNSWGITDGRPNGLFRIAMYYDYDTSDPKEGYHTEWWTIDPVYLGVLDQNAVKSSVETDNINPKNIVQADW